MLFSNDHRKARVLFRVVEILATSLAFEAAYYTRTWFPGLPHQFYIIDSVRPLVLIAFVLIWTCSGLWLNDEFGIHQARTIVRRTGRQALYGAVSLVVFEYVLRLDISRIFMGLFAIYASALLLLLRLHAGRLLGFFFRELAAVRYVIIGGTGRRAIQLAGQLEQAGDRGVRVHGFLALSDHHPETVTLTNEYPVASREELRSLLRADVVDEILFAVEPWELTGLADIFQVCGEEGVQTRFAMDFLSQVNGNLRLEHLGRVPFLTFTTAPDDEIRLLLKRAMDVTLGVAGLIVAFPVMAATAIAIKMTSPGPVIFRQERCGLNGRRFVFYKFRSMSVDAEQRRNDVLHMSQRSTATKIPNDPRLTPIGAFLRKYSIDELPQLMNVIKGDMSLVGPRPAIPAEVAQYQQWQRRRLRMRPGLTCTWAVNGRDTVDFDTWMKMDLQYIDNWSLGLDWSIVLKTIPKVVLGQGAH